LVAPSAVPPLSTRFHPALTTEILVAVIADLNSMKNIGDATIVAVAFVATFAPFEIFRGTGIAPDFAFTFTAIIAATYSGDAVRASIIFTSKALFHINAVHTEIFFTGSTVLLPTTIQAVALVAVIAHGTHAISIILIFLHAVMTVLLLAIIASEILCSILIICELIIIHSQHMTITRKIAATFQANICLSTQIIIVTGEESMKDGFRISFLSPLQRELQVLQQAFLPPFNDTV